MRNSADEKNLDPKFRRLCQKIISKIGLLRRKTAFSSGIFNVWLTLI